MDIEFAAARVKFGAEELDRIKPDWYTEIAISEIWMADDFYCILGQLYGSYAEGLHQNGWSPGAAIDRGFAEPNFDYQEITECWVSEITGRRLKDAEAEIQSA